MRNRQIKMTDYFFSVKKNEKKIEKAIKACDGFFSEPEWSRINAVNHGLELLN